MYRVKGKQGIFMPAIKSNKSGLIRMIRFMSDEAYTVKTTSLEGLRGKIIYKVGGTITLLEAFDNLQKEFNNQPTEDISWNFSLGEESIMDIICLDYDAFRFKDYHAKKIIKWYDEIVSAINKATSE